MVPQTSGIEFYERDESGRITATATYVPGGGKDEVKVIVSFQLICFLPSLPPPFLTPRGGAYNEKDKDYNGGGVIS